MNDISVDRISYGFITFSFVSKTGNLSALNNTDKSTILILFAVAYRIKIYVDVYLAIATDCLYYCVVQIVYFSYFCDVLSLIHTHTELYYRYITQIHIRYSYLLNMKNYSYLKK